MPLTGEQFDHDVFVSYSHGDVGGRGRPPLLKAWTRALVERLKEEVSAALGDQASELDIWYDAELKGDVPLTEELKARAERSALLLIVMSPSYLASTWCSDELEWFETELRRRGEGPESVFVVQALPTDHSKWPSILKDELDHPVLGWSLLPNEQGGKPCGWPELADTDHDFYDVVVKLITALRQRKQIISEGARSPARK